MPLFRVVGILTFFSKKCSYANVENFFLFQKMYRSYLESRFEARFFKKRQNYTEKAVLRTFRPNLTFLQFNFFLFCREFHADSKYTKIVKNLSKIRKISQKNTFLHKKATISSNLHRKRLDSQKMWKRQKFDFQSRFVAQPGVFCNADYDFRHY